MAGFGHLSEDVSICGRIGKANAYQGEAGTIEREIFLRDRARRALLRGVSSTVTLLTLASVAVADQGYGFVAALRVDLLHDSVDVVLNGEFGQV